MGLWTFCTCGRVQDGIVGPLAGELAESLGSVGYQTHQDRHLRDCEGSALPQDISGADGTDAHVLSDALV